MRSAISYFDQNIREFTESLYIVKQKQVYILKQKQVYILKKKKGGKLLTKKKKIDIIQTSGGQKKKQIPQPK
jgi:hypothetical protein